MPTSPTSADRFASLSEWLNVHQFEPPQEKEFRRTQLQSSVQLVATFAVLAGLGFLALTAIRLGAVPGDGNLSWGPILIRLPVILALFYSAYHLQKLKDNPTVLARYILGVFVGLAIMMPVINLFRSSTDAFTSEIAIVTISFITAFCGRALSHRKFLLFLLIILVGHILTFVFLRGYFTATPLEGTLSAAKFRLLAELPQQAQVIQAIAYSYFIYRFCEARERKLFINEQKLQASNEARLELLQAVGHDLRQPMTSIMLHEGIAIEAARQGDTATVLRSLAIVESGLETMSEELKQLTEIAVLQGDNYQPVMASFDLRTLINEIVLTFSAQASVHAVTLSQACETLNQRPIVQSERATLARIVSNIISNAIKFTAARTDFSPKIVLVKIVEANSTQYRLLIQDTGVGINSYNLSRIWDPFYQESNPERSRVKGYGLGLAHVKSAIARLPDHSIKVSSELSIGTTFTVELPKSNIPSVDVVKNSGSDFSVRWDEHSNRKVFIVEDDLVVGEALEAASASLGYSVNKATTKIEGLNQLDLMRSAPSAILVDFRLPDGNGAEVIFAAIKKFGSFESGGPLIICLSGEGGLPNEITSLSTGVKFMQKPISLDKLLTLLVGSMR